MKSRGVAKLTAKAVRSWLFPSSACFRPGEDFLGVLNKNRDFSVELKLRPFGKLVTS